MIKNLLPYDALPHQRRLHEALDPQQGPDLRIAALISGYGAGKTYAGAWEALRQSQANPGIPILCVGPSFPQARDSSYAAVCELLHTAETAFTARWSGTHDVRIPDWNGQLLWASAERPLSFKGKNCAGCWIDEPGLLPERSADGQPIWDLALSRIRHPRSQSRRFWLTGTPEGLNWLYERLVVSPPAGLAFIRASTADNPHLPPDYLANLRAHYGPEQARAMIDGEFTDLCRGQVYEAFRRHLHVQPVTMVRGGVLWLSFDFNRNPFQFVAALRDTDAAGRVQLGIVREWSIPETTTAIAAQAAIDWAAPFAPVQVELCGDPAGYQRRTVAPDGDVTQLRRALAQGLKVNVNVRVGRRHTRVEERVNAVNQALREQRIRIDPGCVKLAHDLTRVRWLPSSRILDKSDPEATHLSDALGYLVQQAQVPRRAYVGSGADDGED